MEKDSIVHIGMGGMKTFIGVKMVDAKAMSLGDYNDFKGWDIPVDQDPETKGYLVKYSDDYFSWCPEENFENQNVLVVGDNNKVHIEDVENMISQVEVSTITPPGTKSKTTLVQCVLVNGFVITESSACVDPANYSEKIGAEICMGKIKDKIWFLMGFLMQSAVFGFQPALGPGEAEKRDDLPSWMDKVADDVCAGGPDCKCDTKIDGGVILCAGAASKPIRHVVDALNRMDSDLKAFICIDNIEDMPGITPRVIFEIQSDPISVVGVNGCQTIEIIEYAKCLIESLNDRFPCNEIFKTIQGLKQAIFWQDARTKKRKEAGVEGFYKAVPEEGAAFPKETPYHLSTLGTAPIMKFFAYEHLPEKLQEISKPICDVAREYESSIPNSAEKSAGLRKLLEAKDCLVRAAL